MLLAQQSSLAADFNYAYHLQVGEDENTRLSFGMGLGFVQAGIDGTKLYSVQTGIIRYQQQPKHYPSRRDARV